MVKIRLKRMGGHKKPFYRIIVADSRSARNGRFIEELGYYDPMVEPPVIKVDGEKANKWIGEGAQLSDTVRALLKKAGALEGGKKAVKKEAPKAEAEEKAEEAEEVKEEAEAEAEETEEKAEEAADEAEEAKDEAEEAEEDK